MIMPRAELSDLRTLITRVVGAVLDSKKKSSDYNNICSYGFLSLKSVATGLDWSIQ